MPRWNITERGKMREDEESDRATDYDALSCMSLMGLPGHDTGIADIDENPLVGSPTQQSEYGEVEDPGVVSDLPAGVEEDES